jgi:hypothetical protein
VLAVTVGLLAAGAIAGFVASGSNATDPVSAHTAHGLEAVVVETVVLESDLGAPTPPAFTSTSWALRSLARAARGSAGPLTVADYRWVGTDGTVHLLDAPAASAILSSQRSDISSVATGRFATSLDAQLASIVRGEQRSDASLSGPGGARVVQWYSVTRHGASATVDGVLEAWDERLAVTGAPGRRHVVPSMQFGEIEALATFTRTASGWRVSALDEKPYQQAT